ncbi:phosphate propanoyltransferase [Neobacillus drentensis]|uniref:phosphate propanoyltransferase n=1 Tax=Neobacillus drentensis TaxID=220684 RepID=UPI002855CD8A|nr:phosphate propanoyltransferase [Neobacillus drentensis]MDR7240462.1 propanediol utilization protein [Neobacillus drentensis]
MGQYENVLQLLMEALQSNQSATEVKEVPKTTSARTEDTFDIPVGVSNRHIHLSKADLYSLFGDWYQLKKTKDLSQPGQYACNETVTICGPKGAIEKVRILGPLRDQTQVEILEGDTFKLGIATQPRMSGQLKGSPGITIIGSKGSVQLTEGLIIAQRHIHMTPADSERLGVRDKQIVSIEFNGPRGGILNNVAIRANATSALECHIDTEEANAMGAKSSTKVKIIK